MPPCQASPLYTTHLLHRRVITALMNDPANILWLPGSPGPARAGREECGRAPGRSCSQHHGSGPGKFMVCIYVLAPHIGSVMDGSILRIRGGDAGKEDSLPCMVHSCLSPNPPGRQ